MHKKSRALGKRVRARFRIFVVIESGTTTTTHVRTHLRINRSIKTTLDQNPNHTHKHKHADHHLSSTLKPVSLRIRTSSSKQKKKGAKTNTSFLLSKCLCKTVTHVPHFVNSLNRSIATPEPPQTRTDMLSGSRSARQIKFLFL